MSINSLKTTHRDRDDEFSYYLKCIRVCYITSQVSLCVSTSSVSGCVTSPIRWVCVWDTTSSVSGCVTSPIRSVSVWGTTSSVSGCATSPGRWVCVSVCLYVSLSVLNLNQRIIMPFTHFTGLPWQPSRDANKFEWKSAFQRNVKETGKKRCHILYFYVMWLQAICVFLVHRLNIANFAGLN